MTLFVLVCHYVRMNAVLVLRFDDRYVYFVDGILMSENTILLVIRRI